MGGVKILHCADLHFGMSFPELAPAQAETRQRELWGVFEAILGLVAAEGVQILLISGDLLEQETATPQMVAKISRCLGELRPVQVFIAPGDHDPYVANSPYRLVDWPDNVHIFGSRSSAVPLPELGAIVYGVGLISFGEGQDLLRDFLAGSYELVQLMLLHGNVRTEQIKASGLDYLALGHRHDYSGIGKSGGTAWAYPGSPLNRGFSGGAGGVLAGEVGNGTVNLDFRTVDPRRYLVETVDIDGLDGDAAILKAIRTRVGPEQRRRNCYRVVLQGEATGAYNVTALQQELEHDFFYVEVLEQTEVGGIPTDYTADFNLGGIFARRIQEQVCQATGEDSRKLWELALKLGLSALEQGRET